MVIHLYAQPVAYMAVEIWLVPFLWAVILCFISRKHSIDTLFSAVLLLAAVYVILNSTLLSRMANTHFGISRPFELVMAAIKDNHEIFRSLLMNILLFCPLGAALVNLLSGINSRILRTAIVCVAGMSLSILIEGMQYHYSLGIAEAHDVICNTVGTFIGSLSLPIRTALEFARDSGDKDRTE